MIFSSGGLDVAGIKVGTFGRSKNNRQKRALPGWVLAGDADVIDVGSGWELIARNFVHMNIYAYSNAT